MTRPYEGVRILDFTQVLAGPYASYQLALLGADVIKVERRGGEDMRRTPLSREWADRNMAPSFIAVNGNKKSLTLDLQKPAAREIVLKLAAKADVVMENFRAGVMDRLGLGYEALSAINPRLIYCAISGFGQTGPASNEAGYDGKIQAMSGIMAITGHEEMGPTRAGFAVCDVLSGATGAFADFIGPVPAHPDRERPVSRRVDAGGKPRLPDDAGCRLHRGRPSPEASPATRRSAAR